MSRRKEVKGTFYFSLLNGIRLGGVVACQERHGHWLERSATTKLIVATLAEGFHKHGDYQAFVEMIGLAREHSINRGTPYGMADWVERTAKELGIEASLRPRGRPRNRSEK